MEKNPWEGMERKVVTQAGTQPKINGKEGGDKDSNGSYGADESTSPTSLEALEAISES